MAIGKEVCKNGDLIRSQADLIGDIDLY